MAERRHHGESEVEVVDIGGVELGRWANDDCVVSAHLQGPQVAGSKAVAFRAGDGARDERQACVHRGLTDLRRIPERELLDGAVLHVSLIHISEPTRRTPISYA